MTGPARARLAAIAALAGVLLAASPPAARERAGRPRPGGRLSGAAGSEDRIAALSAQLSAARPISRRLGLVARAEFTTANADPRQDPTLPEANLGGVDLGAGLVFRF